MALTYKVWLDVEQYDDEDDEYTNLDLGFAGTALFDEQDEAVDFTHMLNAIGSLIANNVTPAPDDARRQQLLSLINTEISGFVMRTPQEMREPINGFAPTAQASPDTLQDRLDIALEEIRRERTEASQQEWPDVGDANARR